MYYKYYDWSDIVKSTTQLSLKLKDEKFDCVIGIARGGLIPATLIAQKCNIRRVYSIGIEMYNDTEKKTPILYQELPDLVINTKVLLVDDIADTGHSFNIALDVLKKQDYNDITTCSLFYKPHSTYKPDHYSLQVEDSEWVVFPWEPSPTFNK